MRKVGFGGGCHWCTEAVFQALTGVELVEQGYIASDPPDDSFSEAVLVTFDPAIIPLDVLIEIHVRTHASTSAHSMREKYRSAIYVTGKQQEMEAQEALRSQATSFDKPIITRVLCCRAFNPSAERFVDYYATDPSRTVLPNLYRPQTGAAA